MNLEDARKRWLAERPAFEAFASFVANRLAKEVQSLGIWCDSESRAKQPHCLMKKLLKGKHTYETLPDKAGARILIRYLSEAETVVSIANRLFACYEVDRKLTQLAEDRVGYSCVHVQARLREEDLEAVKYPPAAYEIEIQIATLGQHLWSEMTHDSFYKSDDALAILPVDVRRRVNLM